MEPLAVVFRVLTVMLLHVIPRVELVRLGTHFSSTSHQGCFNQKLVLRITVVHLETVLVHTRPRTVLRSVAPAILSTTRTVLPATPSSKWAFSLRITELVSRPLNTDWQCLTHSLSCSRIQVFSTGAGTASLGFLSKNYPDNGIIYYAGQSDAAVFKQPSLAVSPAPLIATQNFVALNGNYVANSNHGPALSLSLATGANDWGTGAFGWLTAATSSVEAFHICGPLSVLNHFLLSLAQLLNTSRNQPTLELLKVSFGF